MYPFFLKTKIFFSAFKKKNSVSRGCLFFFSDWKWHHLWWEQCMCFYWYPTARNKPPLYRSTAKQRFQKYPLWKAFWKDAFSATLFTGYVWMVGQTRGKNLGFQTKMDTCGKALRFLIICIVLKEQWDIVRITEMFLSLWSLTSWNLDFTWHQSSRLN